MNLGAWRLPYHNIGNLRLKCAPSFRISVGGGDPRLVTMDTGSLGIVVPAFAIGNATFVSGEVKFGYSSSGIEYTGRWAYAIVVVEGGGRTEFTTGKPIKVFAAEKINGKPIPSESRLGMMGVGIRGLNADTGNVANAFLNLPQMLHGTWPTGYILTAEGVWFGYGEEQISQFATYATNCEKGGTPAAQVQLSHPTLGTYEIVAPLLVDTGLPYVIVTPGPRDPAPGAEWSEQTTTQLPCTRKSIAHDQFIPGVQVVITPQAADGANAVTWSFTSGSPSPPSPLFGRFAKQVVRDLGIVNTGRHLLNSFDYLADIQFGNPVSGRIGFRKRAGI